MGVGDALGGAVGLLPGEPSRRCADLIGAIARSLSERNDELGERLMGRFLRDSAGVPDDPDLRAALLGAARSSVALLNVSLATWTSPHVVTAPSEALAWARVSMAAGLGLDRILAAYRMGQAEYLLVWTDELKAMAVDAPTAMDVMTTVSQYVFVWVDSISVPLVTAYDEERDRRSRGTEAVRIGTVTEILAGAEPDVATANMRLGYDITGRHLALSVWGGDGRGGPGGFGSPEAAAAQVAECLGCPEQRRLVLRMAPGRVVAWLRRDALERREITMARAVLHQAPGELNVTVGGPADAVGGFREAHEQARRAERVARLMRRPPRLLVYGDIAVTDLLTTDLAAARRFALGTLGSLASEDDSSRQLLATLRVFLSEGQSYARTARRLHLHENTVASRVRRALETAGHDSADSFALRAAVELAFLLAEADEDG